MGELELDHIIMSKVMAGAKGASSTKAMAAVAMKSTLLTNPIGWSLLIAAAIGAMIIMDKAASAAVEAASDS
jgi:hypothetical protein